MIELFPHQQKAVDALSSGKILYGDVGSGKTVTALAYYVKEHSPRDVYVLTTAKKRESLDWVREALYFHLTREPELTMHGVLRVDSWNNIEKYKDVENAFFIFDEQRVVGSGSWSKNFIKIAKKNKWILLSGTPGDTWMDYIPVFIANGFYKNKTEFIQRHVVYKPFSNFPKVDRYLETGTLMKHRKDVLVHMPFSRQTTRIFDAATMNYDAAKCAEVAKMRWNPYKEQPLRSKAELGYVLRRIVNSDESRKQFISDMMDLHERLIIFYNFDYELEILRSVAQEKEVDWVELNGHKHEEMRSTGRQYCFVQIMAGAEGWNCTTVDTLIFYSLPYSYKMFHQAQGRIDRLNTTYKYLHYRIMIAPGSIDGSIWKSLETKKDFQPSDLSF